MNALQSDFGRAAAGLDDEHSFSGDQTEASLADLRGGLMMARMGFCAAVVAGVVIAVLTKNVLASAFLIGIGSLALIGPYVVNASRYPAFLQIKGDVLHNVNLGYALAFGMVVVMALSMSGYYVMRRRSERWLKK